MRNNFLKIFTIIAFSLSTLFSGSAFAHDGKNIQLVLRLQTFKQISLTSLKNLLRQKLQDLVITVLLLIQVVMMQNK